MSALAGGGARRPRLVIAIAVVLALGGAALALRLHPTAATSTFVSSSSPEYKATQRFYENFGEEPVAVLVKGNLQQLVLGSDIDRLVGLEGCLSGNVPVNALAFEGGLDGPCGELARAKTVKVVFGPGTFINEAASQIDEQLTTQTKQAQAQAQQARAGRIARRARPRALARAGERTRTRGQQGHARALPGEPGHARAAVRPDLATEHRRRRLRRQARVRLEQAGRHAEGALRLPVPEPGRGARVGADEGRALRSGEDAHDRPDPPGGADAPVAAARMARATW